MVWHRNLRSTAAAVCCDCAAAYSEQVGLAQRTYQGWKCRASDRLQNVTQGPKLNTSITFETDEVRIGLRRQDWVDQSQSHWSNYDDSIEADKLWDFRSYKTFRYFVLHLLYRLIRENELGNRFIAHPTTHDRSRSKDNASLYIDL